MSNEQKLREALQAISHIDDTTNHAVDASAALDRIGQIARQALALPTALAISDTWGISRALVTLYAYECDGATDKALALITAAPDMPLSMNQFGRLVELTREHLTDNTFVYKATSKAGDTCHFGVESAAKAWAKGGTVEAIKVREFKLHTSGPTADHLPDAGEMIETAAPVGELEAFENEMRHVDVWGHRSLKNRASGNYENWQVNLMWDAWQARAALSTGDAVDGQSNASRWVASADRYPPEGERVFFLDLATNIVGFDMWAGEGFIWMPSHWMPIPPAPAMRKGQL